MDEEDILEDYNVYDENGNPVQYGETPHQETEKSSNSLPASPSTLPGQDTNMATGQEEERTVSEILVLL